MSGPVVAPEHAPGVPARFDLPRLQRQLRPLDLTAAPVHGDAELAYFHYYGIDFERRQDLGIGPVQHWFGHFSSGRNEIVVHYFLPPQPRGSCFILHGYFDHVGLFRHVIEFCLRRGMAVVAYDLPGHGLSTGETAAIGDFAEYRRVLADVMERFGDRAPRPWRAIAQSTGGAVLMDYLLAIPEPEFQQCVLLAPLVRVRSWGGVRLSHTLARYCLRRIPRRFGVNSGDSDFLEFLAHRDPLQSRVIPLSWVGAMFAWERRFAAASPSEAALLVVQGQRDLTVDWRHNLGVIRAKFPRARVLQLTDAQHQLANETAEIRAKVFAAIDMYWSRKPASG